MCTHIVIVVNIINTLHFAKQILQIYIEKSTLKELRLKGRANIYCRPLDK